MNLTLFVSFFVLGVIGWVIYKIFIWPFYISPLRKIPGPPSENPITGNFKELTTEEVTYYYISSLAVFNSYFNLLPIS